jgi:hypothetical protein
MSRLVSHMVSRPWGAAGHIGKSSARTSLAQIKSVPLPPICPAVVPPCGTPFLGRNVLICNLLIVFFVKVSRVSRHFYGCHRKMKERDGQKKSVNKKSPTRRGKALDI